MFVEIDQGRALFVLLHCAIFGERIEDENDAASLFHDLWQRRWWRVCVFTVPCWASPFPLFSTPGRVLRFCSSFVRVDSGRRSVCVISKIISNFVCRNASVRGDVGMMHLQSFAVMGVMDRRVATGLHDNGWHFKGTVVWPRFHGLAPESRLVAW